ncbi:MAG: MFS transporter, partial [Candidatus Limnocylindrales bacterium]
MSVLRAYRGLLSNGPLVRLLGGEFVSSIGDWLYLVALLIVVYQVSADPLLLGVVGAARVLPYVLLSIPAGIVADRFERRLVLLVTDVARGAIMLAMAWLVAVDGPLPAIVALAVLATCFSCFFGPTIGAYLPSLVRDEAELGPANSAWSTLDNLAFVIGPAIAGLLIAASGLTLAFLLNAISFGLVAIVLWRLPAEPRSRGDAPEPSSSDPARATGGTTPTASLGRSALPLAGLAVVDTVAGFVFGGLGVLTVVLAVDQLGADEAATGFLNAAVGVGGLLGALASSAFVIRPGLRGPLVLGSLG